MGVYQLGPATHLSAADVMALWNANGGDPDKALTAAAIVFSSENPAGNAGLVNDTPSTGDYSIGLWQINYLGSLMAIRTAAYGAPADFAASPDLQAKAAISMSSNGQNWQPWGPDFGYSGYGQAVTDPTPSSRVGQWLAAHGGLSPTPSWLLPLVAAGILTAAGAAGAWILAGGGLPAFPRLPPFPRLPRFAFARENPHSRDRDPPPMLVQSLLFPLDRYSLPAARAWAKRHGYLSHQYDVTAHYIHLPQFEPARYNVRVVRTIDFGKGIKAHVAREAA